MDIKLFYPLKISYLLDEILTCVLTVNLKVENYSL